MSSKNNTTSQAQESGPPINPQLRHIIGVILPLYSRYRFRLLIGFTALLGVDFLQLLIPRLLKTAIDGLTGGTSSENILLGISGLILLIGLGVAVLRFVWRSLIIGFSRILEADLRNRIFSHILMMDRPFFEKRTTGDIMAHAGNDLSAVQMACGMGMVAAVDALVMSCAAIGFMLHINAQLTVLALLPMPFLAFCTRFLSGRLHHRFNTVQEQFSQLTEFARTALVSIRLIKAYTMEKMQERHFEQLGLDYVHSNVRVATIHGLLFPIAALVGNVGMLIVLYFGGRLAISGTITLGDFVAFVTYLYMLVWPMMAIGWVASLAQRGLTSLTRIHGLLTVSPLLHNQTAEKHVEIITSTFRLQNLSFTYPGTTKPVLDDLTLQVGPGITGITGRTACGKSTLCKLMARLYPVKDGCLFFDEKDVNTLSIDTVRSRIGYVGQEAVLFSDTVAANIALGRPDATRSEIESAAKSAAVHHEITAFTKGYDTLIGERGVKLSGGQRQRLALARALLCDRPVLLIDDALSALDVETEHIVLAALKRRLKGKVVVIVSQRVKLLSQTDTVIILDKGRIIERGLHDDLLQRNDLYRLMQEKQRRQSDSSRRYRAGEQLKPLSGTESHA